jgi:hypothetical protein
MDHEQRLELTEMTKSEEFHMSAIETWMKSTVSDRTYERYSELHIHTIDEAWRDRSSWIDAGIWAFQSALRIRDQRAPGFTVALAIGLASDTHTQDVDFRTLEEIRRQLGLASPSLYLFAKGWEPWSEPALRAHIPTVDNIVVESINPEILGFPSRTYTCKYLGFRQIEFDEYSRTIFTAA